jgi:hypothetical protein
VETSRASGTPSEKTNLEQTTMKVIINDRLNRQWGVHESAGRKENRVGW